MTCHLNELKAKQFWVNTVLMLIPKKLSDSLSGLHIVFKIQFTLLEICYYDTSLSGIN